MSLLDAVVEYIASDVRVHQQVQMFVQQREVKAFLRPCFTVLVALCIVGRRHDNDSSMSRVLTWSREEVKCLIAIWAAEHISQTVRTAHSSNSELYEIVRNKLKGRGWTLSPAASKKKAINKGTILSMLTSDH